MGFLDNLKKALGVGTETKSDSAPEPVPERKPEPRPEAPSVAAAPEPEVSSVPDPEPAAHDRAASDAGGQKTYTVQSGDSLWKIAEAQYGDGSKYTKIFEANRPMLEDPDKIYPGQELVIPKLDN